MDTADYRKIMKLLAVAIVMTSTVVSANRRLWLAALKPPMYSVAVIPIWVGTAVAWAQTGQLNQGIFAIFLTAAIFIVAWINLSNDVFDAETGIDQNKHHSLVNLTGNKSLIFWLGNLLLGLGILGIFAIAWQQRDLMVLGLVVLACFLGYTYQGPPFRLGYQGLGEIICFFCFGPIAVSAAYYSQTGQWSGIGLVASVIIGITTSLILFCSHFHQVEDDSLAGKRSPIVRLGTARGAQVLVWLTGSIYALILVLIGLQLFPLGTLLTFASLPFAWKLIHHVSRNHAYPEKVSNCKFIAVALHFWSGLFLGLGFLV